MYDKITEVTKSTELEKGIDIIEHVEKFNPFHDSRGRFSNSRGYASYSANPKTKAGQMAIDRSTRAGYGAVMNVHRESKGENIRQNDNWVKSGQKPTPSQLSRAQANAPKTVSQARQNAHTNRVKGTMGATETATARHQPRPKKQPQQAQNQQTQAQQNQAQQVQTSAKAVRVTQKMNSGVTMDVDFDTTNVAGARNKEFRGTAHGKDLTKTFDATKMTATDSYRGSDRFTDKVADMQGFNSPMKRVSQAEWDQLAKANGDVFQREVDASYVNGRKVTAKGMKAAYSEENDMKMNGTGGRAFGDGIYAASAAMEAYNSGGRFKDHLDPGAQANCRADIRGYGDGKTVLKMAWLSKPRIANENKVKAEFNRLSQAEQAKYGYHLNTYVCAKGYDAMRTCGRRYMVVFNRSKVAVLDD